MRLKSWHYYLRTVLFVPVLLTAWVLPRRLGRSLADLTAHGVYRLAPRLRTRLEKTQRRVQPDLTTDAEIRRAVTRVIQYYGYYMLDFFALRRGGGRNLIRDVRGIEHLLHLQREGRGAVLATAHLGSWEIAGLALAKAGEQLTMVSAPEEITYLGSLRSSIREGMKHSELLIGSRTASVELLERLRSGGYVGLQLDRATQAATCDQPFFGHQLKMPTGPTRLAVMGDAFILPVFALFNDDLLTYDVVIEPPLDGRGADPDELSGRLASLLEEYVGKHPEQWLMMQDPWSDKETFTSSETSEGESA